MTSSVSELFCMICGAQSMTLKCEKHDSIPRKTCSACDYILYENPKIVVGAVTTYKDQFLLCQRAIEPQKGLWTYPAGFLENNERLEVGASREAYEEAHADVKIEYLIGTYSLTHIQQVHLIYSATLLNPDGIKPGIESNEVYMCPWEKIPWKNLAFPVIKWALQAYFKNKEQKEKVIDSKVCCVPLEEAWKIES